MTEKQRQSTAIFDEATRTEFAEIESAPVHCNVLWPTRAAALAAPAAPIRLAYFRDSGLIFNTAFDEQLTRYQPAYENALHFSPRFREYAQQLADRLIDRYDVRDRDVIDVGCGDGHFLALLCERGSNHGTGFDPSHSPDHAARPEAGSMEVLAEYYTAAHADCPVDLLTCRHVLEHIVAPWAFLADLRETLERHGDPVVYFEVPSALYTLRDMGVWDIIYEHCSYFTPPALARMFGQSGFEVLEVAESYGGQFLGIEARLGIASGSVDAGLTPADDEIGELVDRFADHYASKKRFWRDKLTKLADQGKRAVVWGAGSKGVTFLNALGDAARSIEYVVDVSPRKAGSFIPCTGQRVISPRELREISPDCVILMNSIYKDEVASMLAEQALEADVLLA